MVEDQKMIDASGEKEEKNLRLIQIGEEDMWTDFLEKIN